MEKDTLRNIRQTGAFCVNLATEPHLAVMNETAGEYGPAGEGEPEEVAEFSTLKTGLHANAGETSAVLAIDPGLVDMERANAEFPPFPEFTGPGRAICSTRWWRLFLHRKPKRKTTASRSPSLSISPNPMLELARLLNHGVHRVERLPGNVGYLDLRSIFEPEETHLAALGTDAPDGQALPVKEGDEFRFDSGEATVAQIKQVVRQTTGRDATDVNFVCCDDRGAAMIFIGLPGPT